MDKSKNTKTVPESLVASVMPCFYHFDVNNRVYEKDGVKTNAPVYERHFIKIGIIEKTKKEYICQFGRTINKRSMLYKIDGSTHKKVYTEQEKEDDIYVNSKSHKLSDLVRKADANTLREIERILFVK